MQQAQVFDVLARHRDAEVAPTGLQDFTLGPGQPADASIVTDDADWSLYSLDLEGEKAVFVHLPPETDLSAAAFVHTLQLRAARKVLTLPLSALPDLSLAIPAPRKIVFIFSMGRCGTTLASHILRRVPGVLSLSEPDPFITLALARFTLPQAQQQALIAAVTRFCFRPPAGRVRDTLAIQFHSQALFQAELFHRAFPQVTCIFMYRDAASWGNSFTRFFQMVGVPLELDAASLGFSWMMISASAPLDHLALTADLAAPSFVHVEVLAPAWLLYINEYQRLVGLGLPFMALRYNELNADRLASVTRLLAHCDLRLDDVSAAMTAFDQDSQKGTQISRDHQVADFTSADRDRLTAILAAHAGKPAADLILPDAPSSLPRS